MESSDLSRRTFVASAVAGAAIVTCSSIALGQVPRNGDAQAVGRIPFSFDRAAFHALLEQPYPHRQIAAPASYAAATVAIAHFKNAREAFSDPDGFAAGPDTLHCVAVLYMGSSMLMAFNDAMYAKYPLGAMADEETRPADRTYRDYWSRLQQNPMGATLRPLLGAGVSLLACNNALVSLSIQIAKRIAPVGTDIARERVVEIHHDLAANFLPGTMLVPAGVGAMIAAQEALFTFLP
jgi:intracellular sulfur oxidation DsrE/DsrF family protein